MNNKNYPSYTLLSESKLRNEKKDSILQRISNWIKDFLENAE